MTASFRRSLRRQLCVNGSGLGLFAFVALLLFVGIMRDTATRRALLPPPALIRYQPWHPTRDRYAPGEDVFFSVDREAFIVPGTRVGLRVTTSWQQADMAGMTYPAGPALAHHVKLSGHRTITTVRTIPLNVPSGRWRLVGIAESVTESAVRSVSLFESDPITVSTTP